jgi:hypothetical protein
LTRRLSPWIKLSLAALITAVCSANAEAKPRAVWTVARTEDPITGVKRCVVSAYDQFLGSKFTRTGFLYPVIEINSELGLLVGVSTGGPYRLPAGDILWRVDDMPFRTLRAADNPVSEGQPAVLPQQPASPYANNPAVQDLIRNANRTAAAMMSPTTVASGAAAKEMLVELAKGRSLIYRSAGIASGFGLPTPQASAVGQYTGEGQKPFVIDQSFHDGLRQCGLEDPSLPPSP